MNMLILLQTQNPEQAHDAARKFAELDPVGIGMTMMAMTVVFTSLLVMYLVFKNIARIYSLDLKKRALLKKGKVEEAEKIKQDTTSDLGAAIGLALYLYRNELHDHENTLLTIKKVARTYSPWSSKLYGLRKSPR